MMTSSPSGAWIEKPDGTRVPLGGNCSLGRLSSCGVVVPDKRASRMHATIHAQGAEEFWLIDLGSANGTLHNGRRVVRPIRLRDGDRIIIAGTELLFRQPSSTPEERAASLAGATVSMMRSEPHWLLLADIEEFTALSQRLSPETLATRVGSWLRAGRSIVEEHGGAVDKYLGDGFLACWCSMPGVEPRLVSAIKTFVTLRARAELKFRVVVHHATVTVGGAMTLGAESLTGREINFLFRAEKFASAAGVTFCFSETAHERLASYLPLVPLAGSRELKGFDAPFQFYSMELSAEDTAEESGKATG